MNGGRPKILFADDQAEFLTLCLDKFLRDHNFDVAIATSPAECRSKIRGDFYDVVVLDINFGDLKSDGLTLIPEVKAALPSASILMLSNCHDTATVRQALQLGADDFAAKGHNSLDDIASRIQVLHSRSSRDSAAVKEAEKVAAQIGAVFASPTTAEAFRLACRYRGGRGLNVLITGPTGSGKELIAQAVSRRSEGKPFVTVNCAAIPANLVESELFGHARGAFTGAIRDHKGKFEEADGGDIFLDEVACLPVHAQAALLRVLETKEVRRVGASQGKKVEFRVIAATNEDLNAMVTNGTFREELLARLAGGKIKLAPLRERREDILPLANKFLLDLGGPRKSLSFECQTFLQSLPWPKNIRQLRQAIGAMVALSQGDVLTLGDLPPELLEEVAQTLSPIDVQSTHNGDRLVLDLPIDVSLEEAQRQLTSRLIAAKRQRLGANANQEAIAHSLKISRSSLQRYLRDLSGAAPKQVVAQI